MTTLPDSLVHFEHDFQEAICRDLGGVRRRPRGVVVLRSAAAGAVAVAVALGVLSALPGGGPSAVQRAAAALAVDGGAVLHVDVRVVQTAANGRTSTWEDDSWQEQRPPFDRRDVETSSSGPRVERSVSSGLAHAFDPATNTIYTAPIEARRRADVQALVPILGKVAAQLAGTARRIDPGPAAVPPGAGAPTDLFRAGLAELLAELLRSGAIVDGGRTTVAGREARVFHSRDGSMTYVADAGSYRPIRFSVARNGMRLAIEFRVFEQLSGASAAGLLSLRAQHPGARVDSDPAAYAAALPRLYGSR
jgi:hypothetical protein